MTSPGGTLGTSGQVGTGDGPLARLLRARDQRTAAGLRRELRARPPGEDVVDLASNDYLGLSRHPAVVAAAATAAQRWGAGSTGSRLVTGSTELHAELELTLAGFLQAPAALVTATGYAANLAAVTALAGPGVLVVSDAGNHASIVDACRLSRSRVVVSRHADPGDVEQALAARSEPDAVVVTDSVFSVDGDLAPLRRLHEVCRRHRALLVVDEAHAVGVLGPGGTGLAAQAGLAGQRDVVRTVTLSKALGSQGGAVLADPLVIEQIVDVGRAFIFDTALAPAAAGAALAAVELLARWPGRVQQLADRTARLAEITGQPTPVAAVVSVVVGDPQLALATARACLSAGVRVGCFRPPSVPHGTSRIRLTGRASLTDAELDRAAHVLRRELPGVRR